MEADYFDIVGVLQGDTLAPYLLVWFFWFYGISTFVGYLTPNPFLCK